MQMVRAQIEPTIREWRKLQILPAGDSIRVAGSETTGSEDGRDATMVRVRPRALVSSSADLLLPKYEVLEDVNRRFRGRPALLVPQTRYGRLQRILGVTLAPSPFTNSTRPVTVVFAVIRTLKITRTHARLDVHYAPATSGTFSAPEAVDLSCIQCVVGRVPDRKEIAVIDRSGALSRALFVSDS
jgi:hypothetical protein